MPLLKKSDQPSKLTMPATNSVAFTADNPPVLFAPVAFNEDNGFAAPKPFLLELDGLKSNDKICWLLLRVSDHDENGPSTDEGGQHGSGDFIGGLP